MSYKTVQRRLNEQGVISVKPVSKPSLTAAMRRKHLKWAKQHQTWTVEDWCKVCFSDESSFQCEVAYTPRVWHQRGRPIPSRPTVKFPTKVMVWSVMSYKGAGRLHVVENTMNSDQYIKVLSARMIPQAREWFPGDYVFMQDGAPCHTSRKSMKYLADNHVTVLPWPGNSPDLNPIETLWAIVKRRLRKQTITTQQAIITSLISAWCRDASIADTCRKLVESMPQRVRAVIAAKGGNTTY